MPQARRISAVITTMMIHIPKDKVDFLDVLEGIKKQNRIYSTRIRR